MTGAAAAYRGVRAVVLGASGFVGRWVSRALAGARADLVTVVRDPIGFADVAREWEITGTTRAIDVLDRHALARFLDDVRPAIVFNLAGYGVDRSETDPAIMRAVNANLPARLVETLAALPPRGWPGQRLVHAGTALEYGLLDGIASEDREATTHSEYGASKLAGSRALRAACLASGLRGMTARLFTVYGPGEDPGRLLPTLMRAAVTNEIVQLSAGDQLRDFAYVEDVADGLLALGTAAVAPGEWVNLATGRLRPVRDFVADAAAVLQLAPARLRFGAIATRPDEMRISGVDVARLRRLTGSVPSADVRGGVARARDFEGARAGRRARGGDA